MALQDLTQVQPDTTETQQLPRNMQINTNRYDVRIKSCGFKVSKEKADGKGGNPMLEIEIEIYNPESIIHAVDGQRYNVSGLSCRKYLTIHTNKDLIALKAFMERLGLKPVIDTENPDTEQFVGKCFSDIIKAKEFKKTMSPTAEQL